MDSVALSDGIWLGTREDTSDGLELGGLDDDGKRDGNRLGPIEGDSLGKREGASLNGVGDGNFD